MGAVTDSLARFASTLQLASVPTPVREKAVLAVLDTVGVIIGTVPLEEAEPLLAYTTESGGKPQATAAGLPERVSARAAAFHNGWLADLLDLEDGYKFGGNHPSSAVIPAVLAVAERDGASGEAILAATIAGYEVANRLAGATYAGHQRGFLSAGTTGALGAAAGAGRVLRLDPNAMAHALGIAGFLLPISAADTLWEGGSAKPAHVGQAAAVGVEAALLAARGFTAAPLEGGPTRHHGYLPMLSGDVDAAKITADLGVEYTLPFCAPKIYPCCGFTHGAVDAALELRGRIAGQLDSIDAITVRSYDRVVNAVGGKYTNTASTFTACQFSLPYVVAVALLDGVVSPAQFGAARRADPSVHALASIVKTVEDPSFTAQFPTKFPYQLEVTVKGDVHRLLVEYPRGTAQKPFSTAELQAKFDDLVTPLLGSEAARQLSDRIWTLEQQASFSLPTVTPAGVAQTVPV